ncbi:MAG: methionine aminotransferase [Crocinitomicaceae bacterium]|nr:methionine aminotransferase [Crocinitomicaceae bacterium]
MSKLPHVGTSIFSVMSKMAMEHQAINLSQGFPNFPIDPKLTAIHARIVNEAQSNQYCPMAGHPLLLEGLQKLIHQSYGRIVDTSTNLLVTAGATQAIFTIFQALVDKNDEVIVLDPCYDSYESSILLAGAKPIHVALGDDYLPDWNRIEGAITSKTKFLLINNPHNPSGRVWSENDYMILEQLVEKHPNLLILSDEVYEYITFEKKHISINERSKLRERALSVSSFGKTFHITGWKIGYIVAPTALMDEIKKVHQFLVFCVNSTAQATLAAYLKEVNVRELGSFYQQKRDFFQSLIKDSRFELLPSEGTYFQLASYANISSEDDISFTKRILVENKIATIPVSVFNSDGRDLKHIRLCYAKTEETLIQAAEKLNRI